MTVAGARIPPGATITAVIHPHRSRSQSRRPQPEPTAISPSVHHLPAKRTPTSNPANDTSVFPGIRYLYHVTDTTEPDYPATRDLIGFEDTPGGKTSPLCDTTLAATIRSAGFLDLRPDVPRAGTTR